ncbi:MAG: SDR family oxidoreductase [Roseovarius sp.]
MMGRQVEMLASGCLEGRRFAVTGAGTGIGRAIALRLAALGATVGGMGRREGPLQETLSMTSQGRFVPLPCDIRDYEAAARVMTTFAEGGLNGLVNNAGGQFYAEASDISVNGFSAVVDLNLTALFALTNAMRPYLAQSGGAIVNMSIVGAERGALGLAHAVAARSGASGLSKALALEWGADRIRVNSIAVGTVETESFRAATTEQLRRDLAGQSPIARLVEAAEVAELTAFLLSDAAGMITGQTLRLDGGAFLAAPVDMRPAKQDVMHE